MISGSPGILLVTSDTSEKCWLFHSRAVLSLLWALVVFIFPSLAFLMCAFPLAVFLQRKLRRKKWCQDKLDKTVPVFSNSRNLLCMSLANWISVSTWEHLDHTILGRLPFLLDYILKVHNIAAVLTLLTYHRRLPCLFPIWLQVYSLMV